MGSPTGAPTGAPSPSGGSGGGPTLTPTASGGAGPVASGGAGPVGDGGADPGAAGSGGEEPSSEAGAGTGGMSGAGGGAVAGAAGEGGAGGAPSGECTRELLDGLLDDYFVALAAGDPASLPLAANVKFTENAEESPVGMTDFWMNAGDVKHSQRALDTGACSVAAQAVVPEGGMDLPIAIRIKVEAGEMTEIETIVVRPGDYTASYAVDSDPDAIIAIADEIGWHDEVPEGERATREELAAWIDKYFRAFPSGVCDVTGACRRLENGGGNFSCSTGASCAGDPGAGGTFVPRVIIVDEVRGIGAGFTIFDFQANGHLDMHMMKMSGGEVHAVQAILRDTGGESGWD